MVASLLECGTVGLIAWMVATLLQHLWSRQKTSQRLRLPPGPRGLPFLGYLPFTKMVAFHEVEALRERYGNVFGLYVGSRYVVFLCDVDSVKKTLPLSSLLNRPEELPVKIKPNARGLIVSNGPVWATQRQFTQKIFKKLGVGTDVLEERTHEELSHLVRHLASRSGSPVILGDVLTPATSNVLRTLLMGNRLEYDDPKCLKADKLLKVVAAAAVPLPAIFFFRWIAKVQSYFNMGLSGRLKRVLLLREHLSGMEVDAHKRTYQDGVTRDYIDGFLSEMAAQEGNEAFTREFLIGTLGSFFAGGSGALRTVLEWLVHMCALKPDMQRRIQDEIDTVLAKSGGRTRVLWSDRDMMPYTQAFIWESMRYRPQNPLGVMRSASEDITVSGYLIPRGTIVFPSFWSIFHDATFWGDPEVFRPERFLVDGGTRAEKPDRFIPFSYGKRKCPAESIGKMVVFAFFTTIVQHFNIEEPSDQPPVPKFALRLTTRKVLFRPRKSCK